MATLSHQVYLSNLDERDKSKLKFICTAWLNLGNEEYVMTHPKDLEKVCPVCQRENF
jgi:hypothetical protein